MARSATVHEARDSTVPELLEVIVDVGLQGERLCCGVSNERSVDDDVSKRDST